MKIAVYGRVFKKEIAGAIQELYNYMHDLSIEYTTEELFHAQCMASGLKLKNTSTFNDVAEFDAQKADYMIVFGGDGTILDTMVYLYHKPVPVLGINAGRLEFLAGDAKQDIKKIIDNISKGHFIVEERSALQLESSKQLFNGVNYALNDFVIHKKDSSAMITIHTYLNGEFLNSYWSDGLIISSPTGSTGYSLSCGGPILYPGASSLLITPIAPHNLNVRPMVISDDNIITFDIEGRSTSFLISLDSRSESINSGVQIGIRKASFAFKLIRFNEENYLNTLRKKLMWGLDNRNF